MLNLAGFFHLNLMYSSIAEDQRRQVIRRCYHPLLDLATPQRPLSLETTGLTLEIIRDLDPLWVEKLKSRLQDGSVEFVGSGFSQIIAPLVPAKVNRANIKMGMTVYETLLGVRPQIWLINEMAYSGGLPGLYAEAGAKALVMEWNNTWKGHPDWDPELRYHHQRALGNDGTTLPVLWIDTLDFQKFQRMAHDHLDLEQWVADWGRRATDTFSGQTRFATYYGSDAEIFDFRPGRYSHEGAPTGTREMQRIGEALDKLAQNPQIKLGTLGAALEENPNQVCGLPLQLECTEQPVIVKKQEKYNLNRWAVTGRGDLEANTACHLQAAQLDESSPDKLWRNLLFRWSSDFRTHITPGRWQEFSNANKPTTRPLPLKTPVDGEPIALDTADRRLALFTETAGVVLDLRRGLALSSVVFPLLGEAAALGTLPHGHFDDISFGADFYSGHSVVQRPGKRKLTDLQACASTTSAVRRSDGSLVIRAEISDDELTIIKQIEIEADQPRIILSGRLKLPDRRAGEIHPVHLTVVPGLFDADNLIFRTHNGGSTMESFPLTKSSVHHGASYSTLVTAKGGLGATEGKFELADGKCSLVIKHDPTVSALIPTVRFEKVRGGEYFLRLRYSAQEIDETFVENDSPWCVEWRIEISARKENLD